MLDPTSVPLCHLFPVPLVHTRSSSALLTGSVFILILISLIEYNRRPVSASVEFFLQLLWLAGDVKGGGSKIRQLLYLMRFGALCYVHNVFAKTRLFCECKYVHGNLYCMEVHAQESERGLIDKGGRSVAPMYLLLSQMYDILRLGCGGGREHIP